MYNYCDLNDVEFENVCHDVMESMLSITLRRFSKGKDGGIDLVDNAIKPKILVQVKHYIGSKFSDLRTALRGEQIKVNKMNPNKYYICCGMKLTPGNINEIHTMFFDFMESDRNIITLIEIDDFLQNQDNINIVNKHFKLWLHSTNILSRIYNQNIFIDCESLLSDINDESKYFVQTEIYSQCISCLDKQGIIMIVGQPGTGKTITSKMLALYYAAKGYIIRYTTNGEISDIKRSLSIDKESREIILLDDCLGQHYFAMKESQENELISLAKYIKVHSNKKLILNSRITIMNEAKERSEQFCLFLQEKKIDCITINMDSISLIEKAMILYNHLKHKGIPKVYYENIRKDKNYRKIINHSNYTPRIIEYTTIDSNYLKVLPEGYAEYILDKLNNPNDIWKNEFNNRIREEDRAFMLTLYSLTDTFIDVDILKRCFTKRLSLMDNIDYTINNFNAIFERLNQSMIKIVDNKGKKQIGVINPSVNDFLSIVFNNDESVISEVRKAVVNILQLKRGYNDSELSDVLDKLIISKEILDIDFATSFEKDYYIVSRICSNKYLHNDYNKVIKHFFIHSFNKSIIQKDFLTHIDILEKMMNEPFFTFYSISNIVRKRKLENILSELELNDLILAINVLTPYSEKLDFDSENMFLKLLNTAVENYIRDVQTSEYIERHNWWDVIEENITYYEYEMDINRDKIEEAFEDMIADDVSDEIYVMFENLKYICKSKLKNPFIDIVIDDVDDYIKSYLEPDYDSEYEAYRENRGSNNFNMIDAIFDRY